KTPPPPCTVLVRVTQFIRTLAGRGANHVRRKTQRSRFQEAAARRATKDGTVSERTQPNDRRTTCALRLRLAAGPHNTWHNGLRKTFCYVVRNLKRRREIAGSRRGLSRPRRHPAGAGPR